MASQLASLIIPQVFGASVLEASLLKNALVTSGVTSVDANLNAKLAGGGTIFTFPSVPNPDATDGTTNTPSADMSVDAVPEELSSHAQKVVRRGRDRSFIISDLAQQVSDTALLNSVLVSASNMINRWRQADLIAQLSALLDPTAGVVNGNTLKVAAEATGGQSAATKLSTTSIANVTTQAWGDNGSSGVVLVMNSKTYGGLAATNTTAFIQPADINPFFKYYAGFPVLIDDTIPERAGTTSGFVDTVYLIKAGAIGFGYTAAQLPIEAQRRPLAGVGSGGEVVAVRDYFTYHINGTSFTGSIAGDVASKAEIGTVANWALIYPKKAVGIAALLVNP